MTAVGFLLLLWGGVLFEVFDDRNDGLQVVSGITALVGLIVGSIGVARWLWVAMP